MAKITDYVCPVDAAAIIGCTDGRVYQLLREGAFRDVVPIGKRILISRKEVAKLAREPAATGRPRKNIPA